MNKKKTQGVNVSRSINKLYETIYTSTESTRIEKTCINYSLYRNDR